MDENNNKKVSPILPWMYAGLSTVIIVVLSLIFGNFDGVSSKTLKSEYIKKSSLSFEDLPSFEKKNYVRATELEDAKTQIDSITSTDNSLGSKNMQDKIISLQDTISILEASNDNINRKNETLISEVSSLRQELKLIKSEKSVTFNNTKYLNKKNNSSLKLKSQTNCYDMEMGSSLISKSCRNQIQKFLKSVPKNSYFEIIPLVDKHEFKILSKLKALGKDADTILGIKDKEIEILSKLANTGIGKYRSRESAWLLRQELGANVKAMPVNYQIITNRQRGMVIRAYY